MENADRIRIAQILAHCEDISAFLDRCGRDPEAFVRDRMFFNAVSMSVLQIGELANGLSEEYRAATARQMPWNMIRGMRNALAHTYGQIDEDVMWNTVINDVPKVRAFCEKELGK